MAAVPEESFQFRYEAEKGLRISGMGLRGAEVFTPGTNLTVSGIYFKIANEIGTSPPYLYGLRSMAGGSPATTWLASGQATYTSTGWKTVYFPSTAALTSGTQYCLFATPLSSATTTAYVAINAGSPLDTTLPNISDFTYIDTNMKNMESINSGVAWTNYPYGLPVFALIPSIGFLYGQPYDKFSDESIYGGVDTHQIIQTGSTLLLSGLGFLISNATPNADLWVDILSGASGYDGASLGSWKLCGSQTALATPTWTEIYGMSPILTSGVNYSFKLTTNADYNTWFNKNLYTDYIIGYGSTASFKDIRSYLLRGLQFFEADANFRIYSGTIISATAWSQFLNEAMTLTESRWNAGSVWKPETLTFAESTRKSGSVWKSDTLTLADSQFKQPQPKKTETLTTTDTKWFADSIQKTDNLAVGDNRAMAMTVAPKTETLTFTDSQWKAFSSWKTETMAIAESTRKAGSYWLNQPFSIMDNRAMAGSYWLSDVLTLSQCDSVEALLVQFTEMTLSEALAIAENIKNFAIIAGKTENITIGESTRKSFTTTFADTLTLADNIQKGVIKPLMDTLSLIESFTKGVGVNKKETVTISDSQFKSIGHKIADNLALAESSAKSMTKPFTEILTLQEVAAKLVSIKKTETLSVLDSIILQRIMTLIENLQFIDSMATASVTGITLTENLTLKDAYRRIVNLGNLIVNVFASIISDDISDHFDPATYVINDDITGNFGSEFG